MSIHAIIMLTGVAALAVQAVQAAGLTQTLKGEGPFTVFAPTDAAFEKLPEGTLEALLEPDRRMTLESVLKYHVAPRKLMAADVVDMPKVDTLHGLPVTVSTTEEDVMVGEAKIIQTDIQCSNGVIHVIDKVLMP